MTKISRAYLDKKLRVGKLDAALLFLSSTVGLMFAVIRAAINPATSLITAIPLIFLGMVLPFYYGYVRGALVRSSTIDRYRGWIFFLAGLGSYGYIFAAQWMNQVLPSYFGRVSYLADVPVAIVAVLAAYVFARRFHHFFFQVLRESPSPVINHTALITVWSATFFSAASSNVATIPNIDLSTGPALLLLFIAGAYFLRESGRYASYASSKIPPRVEVVRGRWYGKGLPSWIEWAVFYSGMLLLLVAPLYFVATTPTVVSLIEFFIELVVALLLIIVSILLPRLLGERKVYRATQLCLSLFFGADN